MKDEKGAALITVVFIFAIAAALAMAMLSRQRLDIERTTNLLNEAQAYEYTLGAEELARQVLVSNAAFTPNIDYPGQPWARLHEGVEVPRGSVFLEVSDLQGLFNISRLASGAPASGTQLGNLFHQLALPDTIAADLISRFPSANGNAVHMRSIGFLRTLPNMTAELYKAITPYITAIPSRQTLLNVNTAPEIVLRAYVQDDAIANRLLAIRAPHGFITEQQLRAIGMNTQGMGIESHYFQAKAEARIDGHVFRLASVIRRKTETDGAVHMQIISRDMSRVY